MFTPNFEAYCGSSECSASIKAALPPFFWASAIAWRANVVLPLDSGPYISIILPFGYPPIPRAISNDNDPLEIVSISLCSLSPSYITAPLPNCFSISNNTWSNVLSLVVFVAIFLPPNITN